jgi:hypothetical protein
MRSKGILDYNCQQLNDLPETSPHGSYSEHDTRNLGLAIDPNGTRGTPTAHRDTRFNLPRDRLLDHCRGACGAMKEGASATPSDERDIAPHRWQI